MQDAEKLLSNFISKSPKDTDAHELRAMNYYRQKQFTKSISDIDNLISFGVKKGSLYNLRGVCFMNISKYQEACADFNTSTLMGDKDGLNNRTLFCKKN